MNAEQLSRVGEKLVKRCGSRDPFEIARQLGINVMLCENFGSLKGMYRVIKRNRFIFLNNSLDENMLRIVCAHELGHDQLHRNMAKTTPIHEFILAICITMNLYGFVLSLNISAEFTLQCLLYFVLKSLCRRWRRSKSVICSTLWIYRILPILRQKCFFLNHRNIYIALSADICIVCIGTLYEQLDITRIR